LALIEKQTQWRHWGGEGGPPRVHHPGGDTLMKVTIFAAEFYKGYTDETTYHLEGREGGE